MALFIAFDCKMPSGYCGTSAIGQAGATNAAILAAQILGLTRPDIAKMWLISAHQTGKVSNNNILVKYNGVDHE